MDTPLNQQSGSGGMQATGTGGQTNATPPVIPPLGNIDYNTYPFYHWDGKKWMAWFSALFIVTTIVYMALHHFCDDGNEYYKLEQKDITFINDLVMTPVSDAKPESSANTEVAQKYKDD